MYIRKECEALWDAKTQGGLPCKDRVRDWKKKDRIASISYHTLVLAVLGYLEMN